MPIAGSFGPWCAICICVSGSTETWYYHNSPIRRLPLVKLFATVLQRDDSGEYWLITPVEKGTDRR